MEAILNKKGCWRDGRGLLGGI